MSSEFVVPASAIAFGLVNTRPIYHGFWFSHGPIFPKGPVLTITTTVFTFLTSGLALYTAWILSRIWSILDVLIFKSMCHRTKMSLAESQCAALLVNSNSPFGTLLTASRLRHRGGPKGTLTKIILASLFVLALHAATPLITTAFPSQYVGLVAARNCGYPRFTPPFNLQQRRFVDTAQLSVDHGDTVLSSSRTATNSTILPHLAYSSSKVCPERATCDPSYPYTFSSNYTLTSQQLGLNLNQPFSIRMFDTCYRPIFAEAPMNGPLPLLTYRGLKYGPRGAANETDSYYVEQNYDYIYRLKSYSALTDPPSPPEWRPNSTLILGGDTTILFYYIGREDPQRIQIQDPIFRTGVVSPIVCDTKYQFCGDDEGDCSPTGPATLIAKWIVAHDIWRELDLFFRILTVRPPIMAASEGSSPIAAALTLAPGADSQLDISHVSTERELSRLVQAGIAMTASTARLAALGYWSDLDQESRWAPPRLCDNVIIETPSAVSIPLTPYLVFLGITFLVAAISYADLLGASRLPVWRECADLWALYYVGQLHREVAEQLYGKMENTHDGEEWPALQLADAGLNAAERDGAKYLVPVLDPELDAAPLSDPSLSAARLLARHVMTASEAPTIPLTSPTPHLPPSDSAPLMANVTSTV